MTKYAINIKINDKKYIILKSIMSQKLSNKFISPQVNNK